MYKQSKHRILAVYIKSNQIKEMLQLEVYNKIYVIFYFSGHYISDHWYEGRHQEAE